MSKKHFETHLYGYATALVSGRWTPYRLQAMRDKCLKYGHTEGECLLVERDPARYIRQGFKGIAA